MANRRTKAQRRVNLYRQSPDAAPEPSSMRMRVLRRDKGICRYCQEPGDTVDHVTPRSQGGASSLENLVCCCFRCNNLKGDLSVEEFRIVLASVLKKT